MDESPNNPIDNVRKLQRGLFIAAKRQRERRFHALYDRIWRGDVLAEAWKRVRGNKGAAGIDGETLAMIQRQGVSGFLWELQALLRSGSKTTACTSCWVRYAILESPMPHEQTIGKPYAGNPHVRFEREPQETEPVRHRA